MAFPQHNSLKKNERKVTHSCNKHTKLDNMHVLRVGKYKTKGIMGLQIPSSGYILFGYLIKST